MTNVNADIMNEIVDRFKNLCDELEKKCIYRALGYISEAKFMQEYEQLLLLEEDLINKYDEYNLYRIVKGLEAYCSTKKISDVSFINGSIKRLKENLYEYVVLSEDLLQDELDERNKKITGFIQRIGLLNNDYEVDDLFSQLISNCSSGDLREFLDIMEDNYRGKNVSLPVLHFIDRVRNVDIVDISIREFFDNKLGQKEVLDNDILKKIVNDAITLSAKYDYFKDCYRMGYGFKNSFEQTEKGLKDLTSELISNYSDNDLYRIVEEIESFTNLGDKCNINYVANNLKIYLYNTVKDKIETKENMNVNMDKVLEFVSLSEKIVSAYVRVNALSGSGSKKVQNSVFNNADSLIIRMFSECNQSEIDKVMDNVYEHCQDNNFKFILGVQYVAGRIMDEKRDRGLKQYFGSISSSLNKNK